MENKRLAFIGLEADTTCACMSMLKIMNSRSSVEWVQSEPADADVLMIANSDSPEARQWQSGNKPCVVVYHSNETEPAAPFTLAHPFRGTQLIKILEAVAGKHAH